MNKPNILIILLDGCRADRVGVYGYTKNDTTPNLNKLAENSVLALNHYSSSNCTMPAVISMMTGQYPCIHGAASTFSYYDGKFPMLTNILREEGYYTFGVSNNTVTMSPECGFIRGYDAYYRIGKTQDWFRESKRESRGLKYASPSIAIKRNILKNIKTLSPSLANAILKNRQLKHYYKNDMGGKKSVEGFALSIKERDKDKPFFGYINLPDTHHPYFAPKPYIDKFGKLDITENLLILNLNPSKFYFEGKDLNKEEINTLQIMYDCCINYVDDLVGQMIDILKQNNIYENTYIVFASDHGGMLYEKNKYIGSTCSTYENEVKVPLMIFNASLKHKEIKSLTSVIDVFKTILDISGTSKTFPNSSNSLLSFAPSHESIIIDYPCYPKWASAYLHGEAMINFAMFSKVNRTYINSNFEKIIWTSNQEAEVYKVDDDPNETNNIYGENNKTLLNDLKNKYKEVAGEDYTIETYKFNDMGYQSSNIKHVSSCENKRIIEI